MKHGYRKTPQEINWLEVPLTFESLEDDNSFALVASDSSYTVTIEYSLDNGTTWSSYTTSTANDNYICTLDKGECVQLRGNNSKYSNYTNNSDPSYETNTLHHSFRSTKFFIAYGNIISLVRSTNYDTDLRVSAKAAFIKIFCDCSTLKTSGTKHLMLNTVCDGYGSRQQFAYAFYGCNNMEYLPVINGSSVTHCMYKWFHAFEYCTKLKAADIIVQAYSNFNGFVFNYCNSLKTLVIRPYTDDTTVNGSQIAAFCDSIDIVVFYPKTCPSNINILGSSKPNGTFYCRNDLTISIGNIYGIPSSWTRKDIIEIDPTYTY